MNTSEIRDLLDRLADLRVGQGAIALQKQELINSILTDEIRAKLAEIDAEFADKVQTVGAAIAALEAEVKQAVIQNGESVKATFLHAVWMKGRTSWDTKSLDGFAAAHPEILAFRKEGEPTVSIRAVR